MKIFLFIVCCFLLVRHVEAQEFQLINDYDKPSTRQSSFFYRSVPDSVVNSSVKTEYRSLRDFFMVNPRCIYYDTSKVSNNSLFTPDSLSNPIYLRVDSINNSLGVISATTIDKLVHQFAVIVIKKYKLNIPIESKIILTDYIAGYYLACRNRLLETKIDLKITNLNAGYEFNIVPDEIRQSAYLRGESDSKNNYLKRKAISLADLLRSGLVYTENSF